MSDGAVFSRSTTLYRRWAMAADDTAPDATPSNADETEEPSEAALLGPVSLGGGSAERRESPPPPLPDVPNHGVADEGAVKPII